MKPPANKTNRKSGETAVKVLLFDIESSPNIGYTWGKFEQDVIEFVKEREIICFSYKWLGEKIIHCCSRPQFKTHRELILKLHELISRADVVVGHNIDDFDDKMANTAFIKEGLRPPPPHSTIDTLKFARHKFRFNSNRLGDLGEFLGLGGKVRHEGFALWKKCLKGDTKAWKDMIRYNRGDVKLLEKIYLKERPWMVRHVHMGAATGELDRCPVCFGKKIQRRGFYLLTGGSKAMRFQCQECGKWFRGANIRGQWRFKS
jgi:hypothetical protein